MSGICGGDGGGGGHKREASGTPADDIGRKKKKTGPGSRGVANLTPEQLAKKRANGKPTIPFVSVGNIFVMNAVGSRKEGDPA
jgi:hypothetical protein